MTSPRRPGALAAALGPVLLALAASPAVLLHPSARAESIPAERPRSRPPSELTGWADWEKAAEIFSKIQIPPAPPLSPDEAMKTFRVAPGYRLEQVAAEPLVANPIFFEFDPDGRIWAVEYRGYMRDLEGTSEGDGICRVVVLEDTDEDGRADRSTVFLDGLVMPRTLAFVEGGVLIAEPPTLWFCRDTDGDLKCDFRTEVGRYGVAGNPQHTANGLAYGIDNWLHSADWERRHRFRDGRLQEEPVVYRGQFGVSFDELGRFVTCRESSPFEIDLIPEEYLRRNPAVRRLAQRGRNRAAFGVAVDIGRQANVCFPIRPTPAITLGALELRDDGSLRTYTIVAGTGVYLGDQFPPDAYGDVFVPEAGGHLIGRLHLSREFPPRATRHYPDGQELLASTDERFRPMSIRTGPDGALYFADMYRGVIEHVIFMVPYIADQIRARNLTTGLDMGRIYRVVAEDRPIDRRRPYLSRATPAEWLEQLGRTNSWRRLTAQRLLVERRDPATLEPLRQLAANGPNHLARMHALWTLDGLESLDWATAATATRDPHEHVRATAVRLAERRFLADPASLGPALLALLHQTARDASPQVRLQSMLSLGALASDDSDARLAELVLENPGPLFRTAALTGLASREATVLRRLLTQRAWSNDSETTRRFLAELAQSVYLAGDPDGVLIVLDAARNQQGPAAWRRDALIGGLLDVAPADLSAVRPIALTREPGIVAELLRGDRSARDQAFRLSELFAWPGHGAFGRATRAVAELDPAERERFAHGATLYAQWCGACHQPHGAGLPQVAPPLNRSEWVSGPPERLVRIVLHGLFGPIEVDGQSWNHHMPAFGHALPADEDVAAVLTYIRRAWENAAPPVTADLVARVRAETAGRELAWTAAELADAPPNARVLTGGDIIRAGPGEPVILPARHALCFGERLAYRPALDIVAPWRRENDVAVWQVEAPPGDYEVFVTLAADDASAGDPFVVETEKSRATGTVRATGGYDRFEEQAVGPLRLEGGLARILLRPGGKLRAELADIRALRLVPRPTP